MLKKSYLKPKNYAEEAKSSAEEAKVILLKTKKDPEEAIAKFKLEAEQAKAILIKEAKRSSYNKQITRKNV